jgi:predicted amino acid dehydrogenase
VKFGFIGHPRSLWELTKALFLHDFPSPVLRTGRSIKRRCLKRKLVRETFAFEGVVSAKNAVCSGKVYTVFLTPDQMLDHQSLAVDLVKKSCREVESWGAEVIGLGALTAVVGSRGLEVEQAAAAAVTTGNSLTVYASLATLNALCERLDVEITKQRVVVIGFPGSIALAISQSLAKRGVSLLLVCRRKTRFLERFLSDLTASNHVDVDLTTSISEALDRERIIVSSTSTGGIIDPNTLKPGAVVLDIAQPRDVIKRARRRSDVLVVDGGVVGLPPATRATFSHSGWGENDVPACLAETMVLALEGRPESFSLGRELNVERIEEIGALAHQHGFVFDRFRSFEKPIDGEAFERVRAALSKGSH